MQSILKNMRSKIDDHLLKRSLLCTYVLGLIAHGYCFTNQMASHDALNNLYIAEKWSKASLGRFFYPIYISLTRGRILLPWLVGILGLFWTSLAVYLILRLFHIKKPGAAAAVSAIAVTNPTVYALAATYLHDFDADLFALFLSVAAVCLWKRSQEQKEKKGSFLLIGAGALLVSVCMGIYQSYVSVTIVLIMFVSIEKLWDDRDWKEVLKQGLQGILMLFLSAVFYVVEILIFSSATGISVFGNQSYNGLGNMSTLLSGGFPEKLSGAYSDFFQSFLNLNSAYAGRSYLVVHGILAVSIIGMAVLGLKRVCLQNKLFILGLGALLPLGMNVSYVLSGEMVHDIMRYAFWLIYLLAVLLAMWMDGAENMTAKMKKTANFLVAGCMVIIIFGNIQTSNTIYLKKELEYQSTLSYMTRVAEKMEENEDYIPGETPVVFLEKGIGKTRNGFERYTDTTGMSTSSPITFTETYDKYFEYVLGIPLLLDEGESLAGDQRVADMPIFPKEGSIQILDGILVVKLGE